MHSSTRLLSQCKIKFTTGCTLGYLSTNCYTQVVNNQPVHTQQFNVPGIGEINLSFLPTSQNNVNLLFDKNQKTGMSAEIKSQQVSR